MVAVLRSDFRGLSFLVPSGCGITGAEVERGGEVEGRVEGWVGVEAPDEVGTVGSPPVAEDCDANAEPGRARPCADWMDL